MDQELLRRDPSTGPGSPNLTNIFVAAELTATPCTCRVEICHVRGKQVISIPYLQFPFGTDKLYTCLNSCGSRGAH